MPYLKQSTAAIFRLGPFLAVADGSVSTGLTIAQADIQISKAGGAFAQTSAGSPTTTHDADGWYQCPLTATDTDTLGTLDVQVTMAATLPVFVRFEVVPANVYDSLVAGTDLLDANASTVSDKTGYSLTTAPPTAAQIDTQLSGTHGAGAWGGATGSGASAVTVTVTCAGAPVIGAFVTVKNSAQTAAVAGPVKTNTSGQAVFALDDGSYKALVASSPIYVPLAAATLTVSGTTALELALTATTIAAPDDASLCRVYAWLLTGDGQPFEGGVVKFVATDNGPDTDGQLLSGATVSGTSDATGYVYADLVQGASYTVTSAYYRLRGAAITVPAASTEALEDLL